MRAQVSGGGSTECIMVVQLAEATLPAAHQPREGRIVADQGLRLRALIGTQRAEHIFGRKAVRRVGVVGHAPRHSRMSSKARRSHVLMVFTGFSNFAASCSRLQPW